MISQYHLRREAEAREQELGTALCKLVVSVTGVVLV